VLLLLRPLILIVLGSQIAALFPYTTLFRSPRRGAVLCGAREALQGCPRALLPRTRPPGGRLLRRLRIRDSHGRHGARRVPDNAPRRADRSGGSRGRLSPRADHARAAGVADPRSSGPRRAAGALRGG